MTARDLLAARSHRTAHATMSGQRSGRMLSVTAYRLPGAASSLTLVALPLLVALVVVAARRRGRR